MFCSAAELKMPNVLKEVDAIQCSELDIKRAPMTAKLLILLKCHNAREPPPKKNGFPNEKVTTAIVIGASRLLTAQM